MKDDLLKPIVAGEKPRLDDLIYNLNALQGYFFALSAENALATVYWAEQMLKANESEGGR